MIGCVLFAANGFLLVEVGRVLLGERQGVRTRVAVSAVGRLLLLGVFLAGVFLVLGRPAGLGACGGLLVAQVNLQLPVRRTGVVT